MTGININCKSSPFIDWILSGCKTIETRRAPSLRPYIGQRVGLIETGRGRAMLRGYATITAETCYNSVDSFRAAYNAHKIAAGDPYDIAPHGVKYGYILTDVFTLETPREITTRGIVSRQI